MRAPASIQIAKLIVGTIMMASDVFIFNSAPNASSKRDTNTDFNAADDDIWLAKTAMAGLTAGTLSAADFRGGAGFTTSGDATDRVIYNQTTGALYYDADGTGATAAVQIAQMTAGTVLSAADFFIFCSGKTCPSHLWLGRVEGQH